MKNTDFNFEPVHITNAATNLFNCAITSVAGPVGITLGQPFALIRHVKVVNNSSSPVTVSLYKGATAGSAAGTEFAFAAATSIPGNSAIDAYFPGGYKFISTDFLSGLASTTNVLTISMEGEVGFVTA